MISLLIFNQRSEINMGFANKASLLDYFTQVYSSQMKHGIEWRSFNAFKLNVLQIISQQIKDRNAL